MANFSKNFCLFLLLLISNTISAENDSKEELVQSESKDGKLEIIKQIKKVNKDGSYTIGYEADDGSFKIESRDVLGNIKGTYGYIDDEGEIKRVSYSTSNSSEILTKTDQPSVVQRIPKTNKTSHSTTRRPVYSTTLSTPTSTTALQRIAKLRSTSTEKPNYSEIVSMSNEPTNKPHVIYPSPTPRILLQRPSIRSTQAPKTQTQKSEGQILRPEVITIKPTEMPLFRKLALKHPLLNDAKPVAEESETRSNILRRQLTQEKSDFDPRQHIYMLQQNGGNDATDVYSASVTTGTPRPLFTTTSRPRILSTTTYRNDLQNLETSTPVYAQAQEGPTSGTPTEQQIPANRPTQEPLVAIKHPFQPGTILVPLSQLQGRVVPAPVVNQQPQEYVPNESRQEEPRPIYVRRVPPPQFRPIPVHVDENGYIREVPAQNNVPSAPYPIPIPVAPVPKQVDVNDNDIDEISPPVSTRDFQKLLHQLILRQARLEKISALTDPRRQEYYRQRYQPQQPVYRPTPVPYYVQRGNQEQGPVQFLPEDNLQSRQRQVVIRPRPEIEYSQSYTPTRRVARLLPEQRHEEKEEYLPPDVREMLLLRMLQLAINPALPVNEDEMGLESTPVPHYKKVPVRNVEILGEESEEKRPSRNKRYRERMDYYE